VIGLPKIDRNTLLTVAGAAGVAYFIDTKWDRITDPLLGAAFGWALGHPLIGAGVAFVTPSRGTISQVVSATGGEGWASRVETGPIRGGLQVPAGGETVAPSTQPHTGERRSAAELYRDAQAHQQMAAAKRRAATVLAAEIAEDQERRDTLCGWVPVPTPMCALLDRRIEAKTEEMARLWAQATAAEREAVRLLALRARL